MQETWSVCFTSPVDRVAHGAGGTHGGLEGAVGHRGVAIQVGQLAELVRDVGAEAFCGKINSRAKLPSSRGSGKSDKQGGGKDT